MKFLKSFSRHSPAIVTAGLVGLAVYNCLRAHRALIRHPRGRYIEIDGARLHFFEAGQGLPLLLLHGNGSTAEDFITSGIFDKAALKYRVLSFDRPGFGRSSRSRGRIWSARAQADLLHAAAAKLGIGRYIVCGHSWGAAVALELARRHPGSVAGIVMVSGYHYPPPRLDLALAALPALPVIGTVIRHTLLPCLVRAGWRGAMGRIFGPAAVSAEFSMGTKEVATRPSQLRSISGESFLMLVAAISKSWNYAEIRAPAGIVAGAGDRLFNAGADAQRLQTEISGSTIHIVANAGHMVHHTDPDAVLAIMDKVAERMPSAAKGT
ncbi:alpha/beta fold hydrolase [Mesorhizobium sp. B1-1-8]|uniref:alpha/beta fold hydrolase n=1 Tax=Mesorhizobium sp. B1-1-8 TaxID=2589976 RepID=UPI00112BA3F6|nr:alpha/beta hydrolase [Mesorhizobium sp. B1-1-8]UCI09666.1 alpha/beta hydrolase [Mesorhizobium sp. B1-1-8]